MTAHVLLNPAARGGRARTLHGRLTRALAAAGLDATVTLTESAGHAERLAAEAGRRGGWVVAAGGDGTAHAVANGLAGTGGVMGVLPLGTGNDTARALGMPAGLDAAVRALATAPARRIDLVRLGWSDAAGDHVRWVVNALGVGFDADVAALVARFKWMGNRPAYLAAVLRTLWARRRPGLDVDVTGDAGEHGASDREHGRADAEHAVARRPSLGSSVEHRGPVTLCVVGNGHTMGGGFRLTPDARPDDGLLDVCLARHLPLARALRLLPGTFRGAHVHAPGVAMARVRALTITTASEAGGLGLQADGELLSLGATAVDVRVAPGALAVRAPRLGPD